MTPELLTVGTIVLLAGVLGGILFISSYLLLSKKVLRNPLSRAIFLHILASTLTLLTVFLASDIAFGPAFWGREYFRIIFFGFFVASLYNLWRVLIASQLSVRYRERFNKKHPYSPETVVSPVEDKDKDEQ